MYQILLGQRESGIALLNLLSRVPPDLFVSNNYRKMLIDARKALVNNPFKENLYGKRKKSN